MSHTHLYRFDTRPEWTPGYICVDCGFRIPGSSLNAALQAGASLYCSCQGPPTDTTLCLDCQKRIRHEVM